MKILILENDQYLIKSKDIPVIGREYILEDAESGSQAQNRAFHPLLTEYYKSGLHKYDKVTQKEFKELIKRDLGQGFEKYIYATVIYNEKTKIYKPKIIDVKKYEEIPEEIRTDPNRKYFIRGKLKSWSDYTKKQRQKLIDGLINEMLQVGVNSNKFMEILEGMENER